MILLLMPFVPESRVWREKKPAGTLKRPRFGELFAPELRRTTIVTTLLSACGYAAAFGALQLTPLQMAPGLPARRFREERTRPGVKAATQKLNKAGRHAEAKATAQKEAGQGEAADRLRPSNAKRGNIQRWQEIGGLTGRILFAILLVYVASRVLIRLFLLPGLILFPLTYLVLYQGELRRLRHRDLLLRPRDGGAVQLRERVPAEGFPGAPARHRQRIRHEHRRADARHDGGDVNTELVAPLFTSVEGNPGKVAHAAAVIGAAVYAMGLVLSFLLPVPREEGEPIAAPGGPPVAG